MEEALKKRLVGAVTLVALAVIFIPPLIEQRPVKPVAIPTIPPVPDELKQGSADTLLQQPVVAPQIPAHIMDPPETADPGAQVAVSAIETAAPSSTSPPQQSAPSQAKPAPANQAELVDKAAKPQPPVAKQDAPDLRAWAVQAASFAQRENAQKLVKRLRGAGLQVPDPEVVTIENQPHYRVRVGPMLEKSAAEKLLPKINALSGSKGRIVVHRP